MKFKYIDYGQNITSVIPKDNRSIIIFSDYILKNIYIDKLLKNLNIFEQKQLVMTIDEFNNKVFQTDKIILKEAKRMLTLYGAIKNETLEKTNCSNYYEFITFANEFFQFFKEKNECLIEEFKSLQPWQEEKILLFNEVKEQYEIYLNKNNYIPVEWIKNIENISIDWLCNYQRIIFVDIVEFSNLDRILIKKIEEKIDVELYIQIQEEDFNEEKLEISKISFPKDKKDIKVYETKDDLETAISLVTLFKNDINNDIYTPNIEKCNLAKMYPKYFSDIKLATLDQTEIYKFFKSLYELASTTEPTLSNAISLLNLENHIVKNGFRINYEIDNEDIKSFYILLDEDYKYFHPNLIENEKFMRVCTTNLSNILNEIFHDILAISQFKKVDDFIKYFGDNFKIIEMIDGKYLDIYEKLFEAFHLAKSSELLDSENGFKNIFKDNLPLGMLNLIIKYMNNIELLEIKKVEGEDFKKIISLIKPLEIAKEYQKDEIYFIDIISEYLPGTKNMNSIFTEEQKKINNLYSRENMRQVSKYRFYQSIFNAKRANIFYTKKENTFISPFLEELMHGYNIEKVENSIIENNTINVIKDSLIGNDFEEKVTEYTGIEKLREDFPNNKLNIGAYDYTDIKECYFRFFLKKIAEIREINFEIKNNFSAKFLGNFIHNVLERIARTKYTEIISKDNLKNRFRLDDEFIEKELIKEFLNSRYQIPVHLDLYFKEIVFPSIVAKIKEFYKELETRFFNVKIAKFYSEKSKDKDLKEPFLKDDIDIYLSGRVDLLIESEKENLIIDYKTGKINETQLDFYAIMLYGEADRAKKGIFNPIEGKFETSNSEKLNFQLLREDLINFIKSKEYSIANKKDSCKYCTYDKICRKEQFRYE